MYCMNYSSNICITGEGRVYCIRGLLESRIEKKREKKKKAIGRDDLSVNGEWKSECPIRERRDPGSYSAGIIASASIYSSICKLVRAYLSVSVYSFIDRSDAIRLCFRYGENAKRLSKAFKDRMTSPLETAIWWTEYVARGNGLPYVKSEAITMPWYERHLIDVHAIFVLFSLLALYVQYRIVKYAFAYVLRSEDAGSKKRANLSKKRD